MDPARGALLLPYRGRLPRIAPDAFVAPGAAVIGDVEIGPEASIWFGCVVRGDVNAIRIGARTNLQDGTIVHVTRERFPTRIGAGVLIGHGCIIHGCTLEDGCYIGLGSTVMDGAVVERGAMVAAGALLTPGKRVPAGQLWAGHPARFTREVRPEEYATWAEQVTQYIELATEYRAAAASPPG
jgi:carbonic anhydrase/acetyltransferase-like protein (isoleucine patch superfamily)